MLSINGHYRVHWSNSAAGNLRRQIPLIAKTFPAIREVHHGTINVRFEPQVILAGFDHRTPLIKWDNHSAEVFDLANVDLEFPTLHLQVPAIMYVAHRSSHRLDPHKHEFICNEFVKGLEDNIPVRMTCNRDFVELPYSESARSASGIPQLARTIVIL